MGDQPPQNGFVWIIVLPRIIQLRVLHELSHKLSEIGQKIKRNCDNINSFPHNDTF